MHLRLIATVLLCGLAARLCAGPSTRAGDTLFEPENLVAWCIVPYDAKQRTPEQRAQMLQSLGFRKYAYDWRSQHLPGFDKELTELERRHIELTGVWFPDHLDADAKFILKTLEKHHTRTELWVTSGIDPKGDDPAGVRAGVELIRPIAQAAGKIGCRVGLYNHGGWFGEPEHEIAILEKLKAEGITNVGLVYSLHHGYGHLSRFAQLLRRMKPYLYAINLNGMFKAGSPGGEGIVPLGQGDLDLTLLHDIRDSGYAGPIGILNHTSEDAGARLHDNLDGLRWLVSQLDGGAAGPRPVPHSWHKG